MNEALEHWRRCGALRGWIMPAAPRWKRLPFIRHLRAAIAFWRVDNWYRIGAGQFGLPTGYDHWVVEGIRLGMEKDL